ncbi:MAG TPA: Cof-type HAD-IIB family hydrolase [Candidatus Atopostipes pullistercoris]|uniref:Cof-type HAD-IIB family hydrolase n=1 Tax=Candidatus Atopostipes pullistercoris TaxID=2838467 RepID=A0A9D2G0X4_9LACT|nr:Cof-type HAD-IIB family hydrolase [Candidatus Atopostipes pullistercoris]
MEIKLVAIDLDGTLLNSDRTLSEENRIAIKKAKEQGVHIVLCTGRPLRSMQHLLQEADLLDDEDIAITYNGGLIQKTKSGEVINELTFNRAECLDIYEMAKQLNMPVNFIDLDYIYEPPYPVGVQSHYTSTNRYVPKQNALQLKEIAMDHLPDPFTINKIVISRPSEELDAIIPKIPAHYHEKYNIYKSQPFILEVLPKNVDKGFAMRILGEMLGLEKEEIMGIGDQENDLSLVENAGFGVAMENAIDRVKEAADFITQSNDHHGVAQALYKFVLNDHSPLD